MPIVDFFRDSLSAAYKRGFIWIVTLLARDSDVKGFIPIFVKHGVLFIALRENIFYLLLLARKISHQIFLRSGTLEY